MQIVLIFQGQRHQHLPQHYYMYVTRGGMVCHSYSDVVKVGRLRKFENEMSVCPDDTVILDSRKCYRFDSFVTMSFTCH